MLSIASNRGALSKRVRRFLERERARDKSLASLIACTNAYDNIYLYGGVLRDIALYGIARFRSDIDMVYVGGIPSTELVTVLGLPFHRNRFGGFRIQTERWSVDLWQAEKTWAFLEGLREYKSIESLLDTTITNWESILYCVDGGRLICKENYFDDLRRRYLDVVFDKNPNTLGMYIRLVRAYASKDASILSHKAAQVLSKGLRTHSFEEMSTYEMAHYSSVYISRGTYNYLKGHDDILHVRKPFINLGNKQEPLPFDVI